LQGSGSANYHAIAGGANSKYNDDRPRDRVGLIAAVSKLLDIMHAHITNVEYSSGSSTAYHTSADWDNRLDTIPKPTDFLGAILAMELMESRFNAHMQSGSPTTSVHGNEYASAGYFYTIPTGVGLVHFRFFEALSSAAAAVPDNENEASAKLVALGGFRKV
jgi:hypothetical protein